MALQEELRVVSERFSSSSSCFEHIPTSLETGFIVCSWEGVWEQLMHRGCDILSGHLCSSAGARLNGKPKAKQLLYCENKEENSWLSPPHGSSWDEATGRQELPGQGKAQRG